MPPDPLDVLPHDPAPVPAPVPPPLRTGPITCEFCECTLTPHGHALRLSDKAKKWRDHEDDAAKLRKQIEDLEAAKRQLTSELAALKAKSSGGLFGID